MGTGRVGCRLGPCRRTVEVEFRPWCWVVWVSTVEYLEKHVSWVLDCRRVELVVYWSFTVGQFSWVLDWGQSSWELALAMLRVEVEFRPWCWVVWVSTVEYLEKHVSWVLDCRRVELVVYWSFTVGQSSWELNWGQSSWELALAMLRVEVEFRPWCWVVWVSTVEYFEKHVNWVLDCRRVELVVYWSFTVGQSSWVLNWGQSSWELALAMLRVEVEFRPWCWVVWVSTVEYFEKHVNWVLDCRRVELVVYWSFTVGQSSWELNWGQSSWELALTMLRVEVEFRPWCWVVWVSTVEYFEKHVNWVLDCRRVELVVYWSFTVGQSSWVLNWGQSSWELALAMLRVEVEFRPWCWEVEVWPWSSADLYQQRS